MNTKPEYAKYLEYVSGLHPMPRIMSEISKRVRDEDTLLDDLAELVRSDASLVAGIVKLSNSPFYGYSVKNESLEEAMQRIGLREIARLVGVCLVSKVYQTELTQYRIPPEVFWESGIAAALLMEQLAKRLGLDAETAYLVGLMRECGMLVINYALEAEARKDRWDHLEPLHHWEIRVFGADHMEVAGKLLAQWGFSSEICEAVEKQWGDDETAMGLVGLIELVVRLLARCGCDLCIECTDTKAFAHRMSALGIDDDMLKESIGAAAVSFSQLRATVLEGE